MAPSASQARLPASGLTQSRTLKATEQMMRTPPMVGVPFLPLWRSASSRTSSLPRRGCPIFSRCRTRMRPGAMSQVKTSAVSVAATARKVM